MKHLRNYKHFPFILLLFIISMQQCFANRAASESCLADSDYIRIVYFCSKPDASKEVLEGIIEKLTYNIEMCNSKEQAHFARGVCYESYGKLSHALEDFKNANVIPFVEKHLASVYIKLNQNHEAIYALSNLLVKVEDAPSYILRASAYKNIGNHEAALSDYHSALELYKHQRRMCPENDLKCYNLQEEGLYIKTAKLLSLMGQPEKALDVVEEGLSRNPGSSNLQAILKQLQQRKKLGEIETDSKKGSDEQ